MIEIKNLNGTLGEFQLHDVNLSVRKGEYLAILGPTGAGKTVLVEYVAGIFKPDKGSIMVDGEDITSLYPEERNIGYVPQDYALFPNLTVEKNIAYGLEARRMPSEQVNAVVSEMISQLKIEYIRHRMPLNLSGGEKQRVALGRALATKPRLLLLDEPLSALDENLRTEMARELRRLQRDVNGTFIHVCHNFEEASDVADRIAIMNEGSIVQTGTLKQVMEAPKNEFLARFVKSQNIFSGIAHGSGLKIGETALVKKSTFEGDVIVAIRPESIKISRENSQKGENLFSGTVENSLLKPYFSEVVVDIGIPLIIYTMKGKTFNRGDKVNVRIPPEKIVVIEKL
ncbi:ABC transporter ATP-binding protein [uncultured Desulfosarcina sp.]|uniref:ABC transporter ATP-binding protein n=1 Tax=uncultured Desulfosarcina sp. TaxID=218289 RepID=UPI0029C90E82|nr:ABC transporter ATP-binding protein [uncultured Desulfosarcina sp.]